MRIDNGKIQSEVVLDSPNVALYIDKMIWKEMYEFSNDAILVVLANTLYNEKEYVRSYIKFLKGIKESKI